MIGDLTSSPEPIEIKLFSADPKLLEEWAPKVADRIKKIKEVADVKDGIENTVSGSAIVMNVDPVVAARAGFTPQEIELDASAILQGEPATTPVVVNDRAYTIRVRFPENSRTSLDQIRNTMITSSSTGKTATLGSLANFQDEAGQTEIIRENLQTACRGHGPLRRREPGRGNASWCSRPWRICTSRRRFASSTAEPTKSSKNRSAICWRRARAGGRAGVHRAAVRVPHVRGAGGDSRIGAAFHLRRVSRAAGHADHLQHLLVHGIDHGDRHRGEKRNPAARRRPALPGRRILRPATR